MIPLWLWRLALDGDPRAVFLCVRLTSLEALRFRLNLKEPQ
jgi:hypothetical protein